MQTPVPAQLSGTRRPVPVLRTLVPPPFQMRLSALSHDLRGATGRIMLAAVGHFASPGSIPAESGRTIFSGPESQSRRVVGSNASDPFSTRSNA
ncbi:MAG: hypothetical protein ACKOC1_10110 [Hyphomicrobiales bacterium]